jgi:hypothetical protein
MMMMMNVKDGVKSVVACFKVLSRHSPDQKEVT